MTVIQDGSPASRCLFLFSSPTSRFCCLIIVMWKRRYALWIGVMGVSLLHPWIWVLWANLIMLMSPSDMRVIRIWHHTLSSWPELMSCCWDRRMRYWLFCSHEAISRSSFKSSPFAKSNHCSSCIVMWGWSIQWSCAAGPHLISPFVGNWEENINIGCTYFWDLGPPDMFRGYNKWICKTTNNYCNSSTTTTTTRSSL